MLSPPDEPGQYVAIRYTERLVEIGARPSIGTVGDSYDNSPAESFNGLYKNELIKPQGPWRNAEHVELATLTYIEWFNNRRLHSEIGNVPPAEAEADYYHHTAPTQQSRRPPGPDAKDRPIQPGVEPGNFCASAVHPLSLGGDGWDAGTGLSRARERPEKNL